MGPNISEEPDNLIWQLKIQLACSSKPPAPSHRTKWHITEQVTLHTNHENPKSLNILQTGNLTWVTWKFYIHGSVHRESNLITVQQDASVFSLLYFCRQLYMFRELIPIIKSWYSCNYSFWYWLTAMNILVAVYFIHCSWPILEAVITVVRAPYDGCQHPKHAELPTEM